MRGHRTVLNGGGVDHGAVVVLPGDGVLVRDQFPDDSHVLLRHFKGAVFDHHVVARPFIGIPLGRLGQRDRFSRLVFIFVCIVSEAERDGEGLRIGVFSRIGVFIDDLAFSQVEQRDLAVADALFDGRGNDLLQKLPVFLVFLLLELVDQPQHLVRIQAAFLLDRGVQPRIVPQLYCDEPGEGILVQGDLLIVIVDLLAGLRQREAAHAFAALDVILTDQGAVGVEAGDFTVAGEEVGQLGGDPAAGAADAGDHGAGADL